MTGDPLERRYRRWLLAYPADYRRERGDELIGTLLDLAGPERTRPHPLDILDLLRAAAGQRFRQFFTQLLTAPRRRGNGQIMAYVAFGCACVVAAAELALAVAAPQDGDGWRTVLAQIPTSVVALPLLTRLGLVARSRGRRLLIAMLITAFAVLSLPEGSIYQPVALAEWFAVLWFRPVPIEPLHEPEGDGIDRTAR